MIEESYRNVYDAPIDTGVANVPSEIGELTAKLMKIQSKQALYYSNAEMHGSKTIIKKILTFGWLRSWWNNRRGEKVSKKVKALQGKLGNKIVRSLLAHPELIHEYDTETLKDLGLSGKVIKAIEARRKLIDRQVALNKFMAKVMGTNFIQQRQENGIRLGAHARKQAGRSAVEAIYEKNEDMKSYLKGTRWLSGANLLTADGKFKRAYDHYNEVDNTVEFETGNKGKTATKKVVAKLDKDGNVNLSDPQNKHIIENPEELRLVLLNQPEAYATIPSNVLKRVSDRKFVLEATKEGLKQVLDQARVTRDGKPVVNVGKKNAGGEYTGQNMSPAEYTALVLRGVLEKDEAMIKEGLVERRSGAFTSARRRQLDALKSKSNYASNEPMIDLFIDAMQKNASASSERER